jgi:hypothetical protein
MKAMVDAKTMCFGATNFLRQAKQREKYITKFFDKKNLVALKRALSAPTRGAASGVHTQIFRYHKNF